MKIKQKFLLSLVILFVLSNILSLIITGLIIPRIPDSLKLVIPVLLNTASITAVLLIFRFSMFRSIRSFTDYMNHSFDIRDKGDRKFIRTGFKTIDNQEIALKDYRDRIRAIMTDVKRTTGQNFQLGENLTTHTLSSLEQVSNITSSIDTVSYDVKVLDNEIIRATDSINEIYLNIQVLSKQINQQNESLEAASSAVEEMTSSSDNIARITRTRKESTSLLVDLTKSGEEKLKLTGTMIEDISNRAGEILQMISVINDIASRTNLLAINASIEAAHAGDSGKGFAVVANEIRQLAENTAQNANSISDVLQEIANKIINAQDASKHTKVAFKEITTKAQEVANGLNEVTSGMDELVLGEKEILNSTTALLDSSNTINKVSDDIKEKTASIEGTMGNVQSISKQTTARIGKVTESTAQLNSLFMESSTLVSQNLINMENLTRSMGQLDAGEIDSRAGEVKIGISWSKGLSVQDDTIDHQHRELIQSLNEFMNGMIAGTTSERIDEVIKSLSDYVVFHFTDEEKFLEKNNYPKLGKHKEIHKKFVGRLNELIDDFHREGSSPQLVARIQKDIALGLIRHIYNVDMQYKEYFEQKGILR